MNESRSFAALHCPKSAPAPSHDARSGGRETRSTELSAYGGDEHVAQAIFSNLVQGGFATFVVSGRRSWDPQSYYFEAARRASRRGCKLTRAFLLPHRQYLREDVLNLHWHLDTDAGIDVQLLYVGDLLPTLVIAPPFGLDFGIWDNELVCTAALQGNFEESPSEWRLSSREDLELARSLRDELLASATPLPPPGTHLNSLDLRGANGSDGAPDGLAF